jgi:hypothetical protein
LEGVVQLETHIPSAAKAAMGVRLTARLKPRPFKTKFKLSPYEVSEFRGFRVFPIRKNFETLKPDLVAPTH